VDLPSTTNFISTPRRRICIGISRVSLRRASAQSTNLSEDSVGSLMDSWMPSGRNSTRSSKRSSATASVSDQKAIAPSARGVENRFHLTCIRVGLLDVGQNRNAIIENHRGRDGDAAL
jgi:hypothetical protein